MKSAMQLKALIRNLARAKSLPAEVVLRNYMLERFLERVSLSKYKHQLILIKTHLPQTSVGRIF